jgi:hypothetical protein
MDHSPTQSKKTYLYDGVVELNTTPIDSENNHYVVYANTAQRTDCVMSSCDYCACSVRCPQSCS